jgi:hypothetical protein
MRAIPRGITLMQPVSPPSTPFTPEGLTSDQPSTDMGNSHSTSIMHAPSIPRLSKRRKLASDTAATDHATPIMQGPAVTASASDRSNTAVGALVTGQQNNLQLPAPSSTTSILHPDTTPPTLPVTTQQPQQSILLKLPRELRDKIYIYAMSSLPTRIDIQSGHGALTISSRVFYPDTLPPLCFTNKQFRSECILAWLERTRFCFYERYQLYSDSFSNFVTQFPAGAKSIRMVAVNDYSFRGASPHLFSTFPALTSLILTHDAMSWFPRKDFHVPLQMMSREKMKRRLGHCVTVALKALKYLRITMYMAYNTLRYIVGGEAELKKLVKLVREIVEEGFMKAGMKVELVVESKTVNSLYVGN